MSNKTYLLLVILLIFCLAIAVSVELLRRYNTNHFSCTGIYSAAYRGAVLHANARVTFFGDEGMVVLSGVLKNDSLKVSHIVSSVMFNIKEVKKSFVLTSTKNIVEVGGGKEMLENVLPDFYYNTGSSVIYDVIPQGNDYLFVRGSIPVFFCKR